jgi:hypothetical protein
MITHRCPKGLCLYFCADADLELSRHDFEGIRKAVQYGERYRPNQAVFLAGQKEAMKVGNSHLPESQSQYRLEVSDQRGRT